MRVLFIAGYGYRYVPRDPGRDSAPIPAPATGRNCHTRTSTPLAR